MVNSFIISSTVDLSRWNKLFICLLPSKKLTSFRLSWITVWRDWVLTTSIFTSFTGRIGNVMLLIAVVVWSNCRLLIIAIFPTNGRISCRFVLLFLLFVFFCRYVPMFGDRDYDPSCSYSSVSIEEQLQALGVAVKEGKVVPHVLSCNLIQFYSLITHLELLCWESEVHKFEVHSRTTSMNLLRSRSETLVWATKQRLGWWNSAVWPNRTTHFLGLLPSRWNVIFCSTTFWILSSSCTTFIWKSKILSHPFPFYAANCSYWMHFFCGYDNRMHTVYCVGPSTWPLLSVAITKGLFLHCAFSLFRYLVSYFC